MSLVKDSMERAKQSLICLKYTKPITQADLIHPEWILMNAEYAENQKSTWIQKAQVSILNSAIHQRRIIFVMTRQLLRDLLKNDKNWTKPIIGLKHENYSGLIQEMCNGNLFRLVSKGTKAWAYEIVSPDILKLLLIDVNGQRVEALSFIENQKGTSKGDREGGEELDTELDKSIQKKEEINRSRVNASGKESKMQIDTLPPIRSELSLITFPEDMGLPSLDSSPEDVAPPNLTPTPEMLQVNSEADNAALLLTCRDFLMDLKSQYKGDSIKQFQGRQKRSQTIQSLLAHLEVSQIKMDDPELISDAIQQCVGILIFKDSSNPANITLLEEVNATVQNQVGSRMMKARMTSQV